MQPEPAVLPLVSRLYRAAADPSHWSAFLTEFSDELGGASITLAIRRPETRLGWDYHVAGGPDLGVMVAEDLQGALARAVRRVDAFRQRFVDLGEAFPRVKLADDPWFRERLEPHGMEPVWPWAHAVSVDRTILCWVLVYTAQVADFDPGRIQTLCDPLVPHLSRAFALHRDFAAQGHKERALDEILDRLPVGLVLFDAERRVLHTNLSAQRMIALGDGVVVQEGRLRADGDQDAALQEAIESAILASSRSDFDHTSHATVATRSGRRPFLLSITPLPPGQSSDRSHEAVAVAYFSNPDALSSASVQALEAVYGLTPAEAAVVRGLVEGRSLEEIAMERGVKPDTARSQLKQVFAKTRTSRQAELIRLVLTGVSPLSQPGGSLEGGDS